MDLAKNNVFRLFSFWYLRRHKVGKQAINMKLPFLVVKKEG